MKRRHLVIDSLENKYFHTKIHFSKKALCIIITNITGPPKKASWQKRLQVFRSRRVKFLIYSVLKTDQDSQRRRERSGYRYTVALFIALECEDVN